MSTQKNEHEPEPELKPCPFCGSAATRGGNRCVCTNGNCQASIIPMLISHWNRRITPPTDTTGSGREGETPEVGIGRMVTIWREDDGLIIMHACGQDLRLSEELAKGLLADLKSICADPEVEALRRKVAEQERELMDHAEDWALSGIMPGSKLAGKLAEHDRKRKQEREDTVLLDLLEQLATIRWPFGNTAMLAASVEAKEPFTEKPTVRAILRAAIDSAQRQEGSKVD